MLYCTAQAVTLYRRTHPTRLYPHALRFPRFPSVLEEVFQMHHPHPVGLFRSASTRHLLLAFSRTTAAVFFALLTLSGNGWLPSASAVQATHIDGSGDSSSAVSSPVEAKVRELDERIALLNIEQQTRLEEAREARKRAADQDRQWKSLVGQIDSVKTHEEELTRQNKKVEVATAELDKAQTELTQAQAELEAAQKRFEAAQAAVNKAQNEATNATQPIAEIQAQLNTLRPQLPEFRKSAEREEVASRKLHQAIDALEAQAASIAAEQQTLASEIEQLMREAGAWISFSEQIAPIFHQQCVSCHNARNAKGQYNMVNFAGILADGESGLAIVPGDAQASPLYQHIADGWMPLDADPLNEQQQTLIGQWIDRGARLDSKLDAHASLIRIMPRTVQPPPPDVYRTPVPVTALATDRSGEWLASSGYHEVLIWSLPDGKLSRRISNVAERVYGLDFHADGRRLLVASGTPGQLGEVKLFDRQSGELLADLLVSEDALFSAVFSPTGDRIATAGADGSVTVFAVADLSAPQFVIEDHADWVNSVAWSADGKSLVTASRDKTAKLFDADSGVLKLTFSEHGRNVTQALFLPGDQEVISGSDDGKLRIWKINDGKQASEHAGLKSTVAALQPLGDAQFVSVGAESLIRTHSSTGETLQQTTLPAEWSSSLSNGAAEQPFIYVGDQAGAIHQLNRADLALQRSWPAVP